MEQFKFWEFGIIDFIDVFLVAILLYYVYKLVKGTVAVNIFIGIIVIYLVWRLTDYLQMDMMHRIFDGFMKIYREDRDDHEDKSALVESLITGDAQFSLANYEPQKGFNLDNVDCEISADGVVNGEKTTVLNAPNADHFLVFGKHDSGYAFALVSKESEGLNVTSYKTYDGFVSGDLKLDNVTASAVFSKKDALEILNAAILEGIISVSSEAIGAMEKCYKLTIEYTQQREQFGQSLSKFQALQHRMVDMFMETEFSKSYLLKVLATDDAAERTKLVYGLKHQIAKAGKYVGEEAVQLHGGMGVTEEMSVGHYLKRLLVITNLFGSSDYFLDKYIDS